MHLARRAAPPIASLGAGRHASRHTPHTSRLVRVLSGTRGLPLVLALLIVPLAVGVTDATSASYASNCQSNLRSRPDLGASIRRIIPIDTVVTVSGKVLGGWWKADCKTTVHGSYWFKITAINGRSVSSILGVGAVYGATGLFRLTGSGYAEGIDVSHWQGTIDFAKAKAAGKTFVIAKATEGNSWTDASYARNRSAALAAGLKFTGYHFARPSTKWGDATSEADHFVKVLGLKHGMLVPALDLEVSGGLGVTALRSWVKTFLGRVYARLGVRPMIYTTASFWTTYMGNSTWFTANGYKVLWIAHWKATPPSVPASDWGSQSWQFWQYSSCGSVAGITGCVDLDRFKGSDFSGVTF
jgi:GH25 family lysozyme M1 (1,4-beta-N-acetylmuramidase)